MHAGDYQVVTTTVYVEVLIRGTRCTPLHTRQSPITVTASQPAEHPISNGPELQHETCHPGSMPGTYANHCIRAQPMATSRHDARQIDALFTTICRACCMFRNSLAVHCTLLQGVVSTMKTDYPTCSVRLSQALGRYRGRDCRADTTRHRATDSMYTRCS